MIRALIVFLLAAGLSAWAEDESGIRFVNGDHLTGTPLSLDNKGIVWKSPLIERPVPFLKEKILDVTLPTHTPDLKAMDHEAVVTLNKGGIVRGQLSEVTDDAVVIDTWYAGQLRFNRVMVESVNIEPSDLILYRGPNSLKGWTVTPQPDAWRYANFSFHCTGGGSIARDDLLTDECSVAFDAEWNSDSASYKVIVFSDTVDERHPKSGYEFSMQRGGMVLRNLQTQTFIGSAHSSEIAQSNRARIEIKASKRTGKIAFFVNNRIVDVWTDADLERSQLGNGLHFSTSRLVPMRISGIRVAQWDGTIDQPLPPRAGMRQMQLGLGEDDPQPSPPSLEENREGRMKLANGDSIDGKVKSIQEGKVTIETSLGEVILPVARLRTITLPEALKEEAIARNDDVRAWMSDGGFIVFEFISSDKETITGKSQNFGTATFRRDAFQRIEFNLYDITLDDLRNPSEW
jgi:hypothetical protein